MKRILVINPGSTSTKVSLFEDERSVFEKNLFHDSSVLLKFPHENDQMIGDLDISRKTALVFGTELTGLSHEAIEGADAYVKIPMYGFTESFNISVCAALSLFSLTERMRRDPQLQWQLDDDELLDLKLHWAMQAIRDGNQVMQKLIAGSG